MVTLEKNSYVFLAQPILLTRRVDRSSRFTEWTVRLRASTKQEKEKKKFVTSRDFIASQTNSSVVSSHKHKTRIPKSGHTKQNQETQKNTRTAKRRKNTHTETEREIKKRED